MFISNFLSSSSFLFLICHLLLFSCISLSTALRISPFPATFMYTYVCLETASFLKLEDDSFKVVGVTIDHDVTGSLLQAEACMFVGCLTSQQHASESQGSICTDNFTCCHTEIEKMQIKLSTSPSHSTLTPGQPVPELTL